MLLSDIVAKYFINAARDLSRLDGISRSPAVSLFSETVLGVTTIRTFKAEEYQKEKFHSRIDEHLSVMQYKYGSDNWFCMHLDMLSHLYLGFVVLYSATHIDMFTAQSVGLLMKYSSQFSEQLLEVMEQSTKVEKSLISMERCDAYTHLPTENTKTRVNEDKELSSWPHKGEVTFNNFRMRYRPNCEIALKDITLHIQPGEKVGIVGRTGSGKSSLCLGMFRIVEALGGSISIDGVDISTISLKKLRRSISIVPQEPFLLEGTLKDNLDPLNMYTEQEIMNVLKQVKFFDTMEASENMKEGIHTRIKEYGNNMSFGCRQLLCFARAILRKSKIIVLDEATSSVDQKTENVIQNAVDEMFKDSTVITIAHRIQTVRKCDRIFVMDNGKVVECGKPDVLINDKESKFYSLYYKNMQVV
jgi:ABC-type multidrug transport system fused ATPase/permease subunit